MFWVQKRITLQYYVYFPLGNIYNVITRKINDYSKYLILET